MPHRTLLPLSLPLLVLLLLIHTPLTTAAPRVGPRQEPEADDDFFAEFTRPRAGDTLVTGSVAEVSWRTGDGGGHVMLEVAEGDPELRHFVYVDCEPLLPLPCLALSLFPSSSLRISTLLTPSHAPRKVEPPPKTTELTPPDDLDYASGSHNWTVPENLTPGSYSFRLANSSDPSVYADSSSFEVIHAAPAPTAPPSPPSGGAGSLTRADTIGLGVGLGVVGLLVVCGVWLFWRRRRGMGTGRGRGRDDSGVRRGAFPGDGPGMGVVKTEEDKLPEGVVSAWGPEGRLSPVELPAEMLERMSGEARDGRTSRGVEERLELSGSVNGTSIDEEVVDSREGEGGLRRGDVDGGRDDLRG